MRLLRFAVLLLAAISCRHRPAVVQVPVQYLAQDNAVQTYSTSSSKISSKRILLKVENRFGDSRQIGQDASRGIPILAEPEELTRLVDSGFRRKVGQMGAQLAVAADVADVVLTVGVTVVNVDEGGRYAGRVVARVEVSDPGGEVQASSTLEGGSIHEGQDYNGGEANVALNKALEDLIARVFTDPSLMTVLSRGGGAAH